MCLQRLASSTEIETNSIAFSIIFNELEPKLFFLKNGNCSPQEIHCWLMGIAEGKISSDFRMYYLHKMFCNLQQQLFQKIYVVEEILSNCHEKRQKLPTKSDSCVGHVGLQCALSRSLL